MPTRLVTPDPAALRDVLPALCRMQQEGGPVQLHPGDVGWRWKEGAGATAAAVRVWHRDGAVVAVGLLDEPTVLRLALAPSVWADEELGAQLAADLEDPARGVLPAGSVDVEARFGGALAARLRAAGWGDGDPWTPLRRDLTGPVEDSGLRIEIAGPQLAAARTAVQRAAFERSRFTDERWAAMASGPLYADARCLLAYDDEGTPVAAATVWSAGPGRPGLLEPLGVHRDHRGRGHGRAIALAAAAALRELGSSCALVCTPTANAGGVATYVAAGFERRPDVPDLRRPV